MAESALEKAIELEPDDFEPRAVLALFLASQKGRNEDAKQAKKKALERAPKGLDIELWARRFLTPLVLQKR